MSNLDQIIDYTKIFQDVELSTAIGQLKQNPSQLQQFLQEQQGKVYSDVIKQKDSTFQKVYGDLNRASQAQESILMYDKRNKELASIQQQIYNNQKNSATAVTDDKNLAGRKYEMNEWTVNNKKETLFIFSLLFVALSALVLITTLLRMGILSSALWVGFAAPIIIITILVLLSRTQYTNILRNNRYWNRKNFEGKYGKIPIPVCPGALSGIESELSGVEQSISGDISSMEQNVASTVQNVSQDVSQDISSVTSKISSFMN